MIGTPHEVWPTATGVGLANIQDGAYSCELQSWDEVNDLVARLRAAAVMAFGPDYSQPGYDE